MTLHALQRRLASIVPGVATPELGRSLEASVPIVEAPNLVSALVLEHNELRAQVVRGDARPGFAAFLDGTQASDVVAHVGGVPIICGRAAAVVRRRVERRAQTWRQVAESRVYAPRKVLSAEWNSALHALGAETPVIDTSESEDAPANEHPFAVQESAIRGVQKHRRALEQRLADAWVAESNETLFVDGGISGNHKLSAVDSVVGVVKNHTTLYAMGAALRVVLRLCAGERSSVFRIESSKRSSVASWYLRLRDPAGHDPFWGLVRVETREPSAAAIGDRADEVSRWILAERTPVALPDARWDRMIYGVRDCEEFLRATR